ncbi:unnamed protein product [Phaedon cochleariae]|uniref:TTF-type domain-containing protein n=1 Tax=Phaedon cochleariae TaxID=80249 RepID=A0A9N9SK08_PHACE|nr:unnamed protein product [Phaedon cochleariae]
MYKRGKSGSEKRKRQREKQCSRELMMAKIPKLQDLFKPKNEKSDDMNQTESFFCTSSGISTQEINDVIVSDVREQEKDDTLPATSMQLDKNESNSNEESLKSETEVCNIDRNDPATWIINESTVEYICMNGYDQNIEGDFSKSSEIYSTSYNENVKRSCSKNIFLRRKLNGERVTRKWLVYSPSTGKLFCVPCKLFSNYSSNESKFAKDGFCDWKNVTTRVSEHENTSQHRTSCFKLSARGKSSQRIDHHICEQIEEEKKYWREVLKRVVATVQMLTARGLAFKGTNQSLGSPENGNFLGCIELIAQFDPFLASHLSEYGNRGKGNVSYLSANICDEFIQLMADEVMNVIIGEIKMAKYFSISVDSTPDISHFDQLTFIIRYVQLNGIPTERFICFIQNVGHKSESITDCILSFLAEKNINIKFCRGQSYDNASNMSGVYTGVQARIKEVNPLAQYVPCSAHSLNLVGTCAAESCPEAVNYFSLLQELYNFFSASTHRWEILDEHLKQNCRSTSLKNLSKTRWSARADACRSLAISYREIYNALNTIGNDVKEKSMARVEANNLAKKLDRLETALMTTIWSNILKRFDQTNKKLQSSDIDIDNVVHLYNSLSNYILSMRDDFRIYEEAAKDISTTTETRYEKDFKRKKVMNKKNEDRTSSEDAALAMDGSQYFKTNTFYVIVDTLWAELERRGAAYRNLDKKFSFLTKLDLNTELIRTCAKTLINIYNEDLEPEFEEECIHLKEYLNTLEKVSLTFRNLWDLLKDSDIRQGDPDIQTSSVASPIFKVIPKITVHNVTILKPSIEAQPSNNGGVEIHQLQGEHLKTPSIDAQTSKGDLETSPLDSRNVFDMTNSEIEQLATFMGHTVDVHSKVYRLPDDVYQTAKIAKLLMLMERGDAGKYKGKSLEDIDINMDEEIGLQEDMSANNCLDGSDDEVDLSHEIADSEVFHDEPLLPKPSTPSKYKPKRVLVPWTTQQKKIVLDFFKNHIKHNRPPKRNECEELLTKYPDLLSNKSWTKIKVFVQNVYTKKSQY